LSSISATEPAPCSTAFFVLTIARPPACRCTSSRVLRPSRLVVTSMYRTSRASPTASPPGTLVAGASAAGVASAPDAAPPAGFTAAPDLSPEPAPTDLSPEPGSTDLSPGTAGARPPWPGGGPALAGQLPAGACTGTPSGPA
jgi:hypothetical protein